MTDRKLSNDVARCDGVATHEMSEKKRGLFGELWQFISGGWVAEIRAAKEERQEREIDAMEVPDCGDKRRHYMQWASAGYCVDCIAIRHAKREQERNEKLADMIAKRVLEGLERWNDPVRVKPKPLPAANAAEVMTQCAAKPSPQSPWTTYAPESARSVQELARARAKQQLLTDIRMDMTICEIEGWDKKEYLSELRDMINQLGTGGMEAKA